MISVMKLGIFFSNFIFFSIFFLSRLDYFLVTARGKRKTQTEKLLDEFVKAAVATIKGTNTETNVSRVGRS